MFFQQLKYFFRFSKKALIYFLLSLVVTIGINTAIPNPSYGSWFDIIDNVIRNGVPFIQLSSLSDSDEIQLGQQINQQLIDSGRVKIHSNSQINSYLDGMGQKLASQSSRPDIPYTFQVVEDSSVNAFATMGGFVYIHTGLMTTAENEAELASVVAHEIGHIAGRHAVEQMRQRALSQGLLSATGLDRATAVQLGVDIAVNLPNSRSDEFEADDLGLTNIKAAGYAPSGMLSFMRKLQELSNSSVPTFLSTHPATSDRVVALESKIDHNFANNGQGLNNRAYQRRIRPLL